MSLMDRIRGWLEAPGGQTRRRARAQAEPIATLGREPRSPGRAPWIGLGVAAAAAVALTAGLVFLILTLTRPGDPRPAPGSTPAAAISPTALPVSEIFATATATSAAVPTVPPRGERVQVGNTGGEGVTLRAEPSPTGERIRVLPEGTVVEVIGPDQNVGGERWRNVRDLDGTAGWVVAGYLFAEGTAPPPVAATSTDDPVAQATARPAATAATAAPRAPASRAQVGNTDGQGANIRSEPGAGGRVLKTLAEGTTIDVLGPEREVDGRVWRQVRDPAGVTGWIVGGALAAPGTVPTPLPPGSRPTASPAPKPAAPPAPAGPTSTPARAPTSTPSGAPSIIQPRPGGATPTGSPRPN
jgi:SH3-like domain-containing protein